MGFSAHVYRSPSVVDMIIRDGTRMAGHAPPCLFFLETERKKTRKAGHFRPIVSRPRILRCLVFSRRFDKLTISQTILKGSVAEVLH